MWLFTSPRFHRFMGSLSIILLLSTLALVLPRQDSVQMADATEPALRGAFEMAGPEAIVRPVLAGIETENNGSEPWTNSEIQQPADLAKELSDPKSKKPVIIYVGFEFLYWSARIPGAVFHGPAANPCGLEELKKWADNVPRGQPIVIYCGCCPWNRCPNVRPAFKALHEMGFSRLKVLFLKTDLATDWVQKGFPVQKRK